MTRREFLATAAAGPLIIARTPLIVPVHHVVDTRAKLTPEQIHNFRSRIWAEAIRDFRRCALCLQSGESAGEVRRTPSGQPIFTGLESGVINMVVTDRIPMEWDNGRALNGLTTMYRGYHLCVIALNHAHGHQIPFLSINTCVHELLHALLHDIFENRPKGFLGQAREMRIDLYATRLWLFHDGSAISQPAHAYVERLRSGAGRLD